MRQLKWKTRVIFRVILVLALLISGITCVNDAQAGKYTDRYHSFTRDLVADILSQHVKIVSYYGKIPKSWGSGVVIDHKKGYIVTARHVVDKVDSVRVIMPSGEVYKVVDIELDKHSDVAILMLGQSIDATSAKLSPNKPFVGQDVYLCGIPVAYNLGGSISKGVVSGIDRADRTYPKVGLYQTDALIAKGSSGGGWYDLDGNLIAITNYRVGFSGNVGLGTPSTVIIKLLAGVK